MPEVPTGRAVTQTLYGGPEVLELIHRPVPRPGAGQVLVRVRAASVNARDWHVMRGEPRLARLMDRSVFARRGPRVATRGTDLAGVVEAVGEGVTRWQPGDRVFGEGEGTFADHAIAADDQLAALPVGVSFEDGATLPLAGVTALLCVEQAQVGERDALVVNGASGGVGTFAIQVATAMGVRVTAVVSTRNVATARSLGADDVLDYTSTDFTRAGRSYDAVVDLVGNRRLRDLGRAVRPGGRLVLSGGGRPGEGRTVGPLWLLLGAAALARFQPYEVATPRAVPDRRSLERVAALVAAGTVRPVIDRIVSLEEVPDAMHHVERVHPQGKVVISVR